MENQMNDKIPDVQPTELNQINQPASIQPKSKLNYWMIVSIGLFIVLIGSALWFVFYNKSNNRTASNLTSQSSSIPSSDKITLNNSKIYTNDFYHISFQLPADWKSQDYKTADGRPAFKLTSANGEISIETPLPDVRQEGTKSSNHIKQELDRTTVQLGEYSISRSRYINDFDETQDYISLYNIPFQKIVNLSFTVKSDYEKNNQTLLTILKTFKFSQKEASLDALISYQLPTGWTREQRNPANETDDDSLSFVSSDYQPNIGMGINTGAMLRISRNLKDPRKTMMQIIEQNLPVPLEKESSKAIPVKVGTTNGLNLFTCWEGCYDGYYIEQNDYYWLITFSCAGSCSTKADMDASKYAKDRDIFLNSFSFK